MGLLSTLLKGAGTLSGQAVKQPGLAIGSGISNIWKALSAGVSGKGVKEGARVLGKNIKSGAGTASESSMSYFDDFANVFRGASKSGRSLSGLASGAGWLGSKSAHLGGKVMSGLTYKPVAIPLVVGAFGIGAVRGGAGASIDRSNERTMANASRGMAANNLGTDGLTLALSRRRHR
jgi:hypothetical protein